MKGKFSKFRILPLIIFLSMAFSLFAEAEGFLVGPAIDTDKTISGRQLQNLAVEEGLMPPNINSLILEEWQNQGESVLIWIASPEENKLGLIEGLKRIHQANNVEMKKDSRDYLNKVNVAIYEAIRAGKAAQIIDKGVIEIFRDISVLAGDYHDNRSQIEVIKEHFGQDGLKKYKRNYPRRYREMIE